MKSVSEPGQAARVPGILCSGSRATPAASVKSVAQQRHWMRLTSPRGLVIGLVAGPRRRVSNSFPEPGHVVPTTTVLSCLATSPVRVFTEVRIPHSGQRYGTFPTSLLGFLGNLRFTPLKSAFDVKLPVSVKARADRWH